MAFNLIVFYIIIIVFVFIAVVILLTKKFLKKCLKKFNFFADSTQVHQPVSLENLSNEIDLKHNDLKLEDISSYDKKDEKEENIDLNFENLTNDINTAKESKTSDSPKETQKIEIEFSRVEDISKMMGTEA